ncbi:cilia- and flagella-associated protein 57-like [Schistocerca piceifrons]|uniref:cilia- and flagella-associated protein 57-like n=1 Tax=Schistocerca piceifrons TaxID=274613 RepID=UPI001F5F14FD|nr:cilia- and flagella-associated protein 57-like [Schistocerca piceifrons]
MSNVISPLWSTSKGPRQIGDILEEKKRAMSEIQQKYELKLHNKEMQIDDLLKETQDRVQEHESIVTQLEDEVDANVINIKEHFENLLEEEKIASAELRREIVGTKNKFKSSVEKDVDEYRCQIQKMQNEQKTFKEMIELFEKDIVDIKTEIAERDISLAEKEKQLYTLTRDKQELEKINSILNYGIEELKNELPIKDNEIKSRMEQIRQGEVELEELQKNTTVLEQQIDELKKKLNIKNCELDTVLASNKTSKALLQQFQKDLHDCSGLVQYPKELRIAVKSMYNRYGCDTDFLSVYEQDVNAKKEIRRQTEYLKQTISTLHTQAFKSHSRKHGSVAKFMEQNRELIAEINKLRRELKEAQQYKADLEKILGAGGKFVPPAKAKARLQRALKKNEDLHNEFRRQLQDKDKIILQMKEDVQRLVKKLSKNEHTDDGNGHDAEN